jgi:hypothetical protein
MTSENLKFTVPIKKLVKHANTHQWRTTANFPQSDTGKIHNCMAATIS